MLSILNTTFYRKAFRFAFCDEYTPADDYAPNFIMSGILTITITLKRLMGKFIKEIAYRRAF